MPQAADGYTGAKLVKEGRGREGGEGRGGRESECCSCREFCNFPIKTLFDGTELLLRHLFDPNKRDEANLTAPVLEKSFSHLLSLFPPLHG